MKVLYAIQGTGNGHISRARDIIPELNKYCETNVLVSGYQADIELPFQVDYKLRGLSFIFGKKGGVDLWNTYIKANLKQIRSEINALPVEKYDFIINDFEPISSWAAYRKKIPCIALSHQSAVLAANSPKPKNIDIFGKFILKNYAPSSMQFGFHFCKYAQNMYTPVIRKEIREAERTERGHYTVYLPSYDDESLISFLEQIKDAQWQIFSKHYKNAVIKKNIEIYPITNEGFISSMASSKGVLCGAGFETPAEAMFLGKKLMVVPMKNQYEQQCNAAALKGIGIPIIKKLRTKNLQKIQDWVESDYRIEVNYPDLTAKVVSRIFENQVQNILSENNWGEFNLNYQNKDIAEQSEDVNTTHFF